MESVTFVYALATEQERQTEALKNQKQNQLERYCHVIHRQMEKERAFLSYKKVEFLSRQETKFSGTRPFSARARLSNSLPGITTKGHEIAQKNGLLVERNEISDSAPFFYRQRTHLDARLLSSKPSSTNSSPAEMRKPSPRLATIGSENSVKCSRTSNLKGQKRVHFEGEKNATRPVLQQIDAAVTDLQNQTFGKRRQNLQKYDGIRNRATKQQRGRLSEDCSKQEKDETAIKLSNKTRHLHSSETDEETATKARVGQASWALLARLIGLKMKFKRRQIHGEFQAPELEVMDPSLKTESRVRHDKFNDPWQGVKGCRYLRIPTHKK